MTGPPWPRLVATGPYQPPKLIVWPIIVGVAVYAAYVLALVIIAAVNGTSSDNNASSQSRWLVNHDSALVALNHDLAKVTSDDPKNGGSSQAVVADLRQFHADVSADQQLPSPPGAAAAPWHAMLDNYAKGSSQIVTAIQQQDPALAAQAQQTLTQGDDAARQLNTALGVTAP